MQLARQAFRAPAPSLLAGRPQRRRCRSNQRGAVAAAESTDKFIWKGGGAERASAWEQRALEGRGGYAKGRDNKEWFFSDDGPEDRPPIVLLTGFPSYSYAWRNVIGGLVSAGRRVIALDTPGFGNSEKPETGSFEFSVEAYTSSLSNVLFDALKLKRGGLDLVAHGYLAGTIGALMVGRDPSCARTLVLMNTPLDAKSAGDVPPPLRFLLNPLLAPLQAQNPLTLLGSPVESAGIYRIEAEDMAAYMAPAMGDSRVGWGAIAAAQGLRRDGPRALSEALGGLSGKAVEGRVVVIHGKGDRWLGGEPPAEALPQARRVLVAEAGHFVPEDYPQKAVEVILAACA